MHLYSIPRQPGEFQQPLTADQLRMLCRRAWGEQVEIVSAAELSSGLFNTTYLLEAAGGEKQILRVAPRETGAVFVHERLLLRREQALEPHLRFLGGLIPRTTFADFSQELIDRDYVVQTLLPGEIWDEIKEALSPVETGRLWRELGMIAARIHRVSGERFGYPAGEGSFDRWSAAVEYIVGIMIAELADYDLGGPAIDRYQALLRRGRHFLDEIDTPRLVHGDLWPKNVLIQRVEGEPATISGLLDAERGIWGDPLAEWIFYFLEVPAEFWAGYGRPAEDQGTRFRQQAYRGLYAIQILLETTRFGWDQARFWEMLVAVAAAMEKIIEQ